MRTLLAASCAVLLGAGCLIPQPPLLTIHASLRSDSAAPPVRLAMLWVPSWFGTAEGRPPVVSDVSEVAYQGALPRDVVFELRNPPPEAAMVDLALSGGTGKEAYGVLVAFEDRNGNGTLDLGTSSAPSPDRIIGVSEGDPSLPPPLHHTFVAYYDGTPGQEDYLWTFQPKAGYTLFEGHSDYGLRLAPPGTVAGVELTNTDALQVYGCSEMDQTWGFRVACGIDPYAGDYRIFGAVNEWTESLFYVEDAHGPRSDATITLDGAPIPYEAQSGSYPGARPAAGVHTLQFDVPGYPTEQIPVSVPAPVRLTTSIPATVPMGSRLTLAWSDDPAIELYDVLVYDQDRRYIFHENFNENSFTTEPITRGGNVLVRVLGLGPLAFGAQGHWVRAVSRVAGTLVVE